MHLLHPLHGLSLIGQDWHHVTVSVMAVNAKVNANFFKLSLPILTLIFMAIPVLFKSILFCFIMGAFLGPILDMALNRWLKRSDNMKQVF